MFRRNRYRRGPYAMAEPAGVPRIVKAIIWLIVLGFILFYLLRWFFGLFGAGNELQRRAVTLAPGGTVNVSVDGGLMKKTDTGLSLYEGDKVATDGGGSAVLSFFDGTRVRLSEQTEITIEESMMGEEESAIDLTLVRGTLWVSTPEVRAFSGSITRTVTTPSLTVTALGHAEAMVSETSLLVFSAQGLGLPVTVKGSSEQAIIGEGQKFTLPEGETIGSDLYAYRSALTAEDGALPFVIASRGPGSVAGTGALPASQDMLVLTSPQEGMTVDAATVSVKGNVSTSVQKIRINGVAVAFDKTSASFSQDIMVDGDEFAITVDALDATDNVLATAKRTVRRQAAAVSSIPTPAFTDPVKTGETYRTTEKEIVIRGTNGGGVAGILVNDYRLQLFTPGKGTWSYLANADLGNMKVGTNTYDVVAIDENGAKSAAARITIIYDDGTLPPPSSAPAAGESASSAPAQIDESTLPQNAPLTPGSLQVTGPTAGTSHTATGGEILLEGTTSAQTASVWVNGYKLQLYKPGVTTWNYIARESYGNLKKGTNAYKITARNEKNEIIDTITYTVTY